MMGLLETLIMSAFQGGEQGKPVSLSATTNLDRIQNGLAPIQKA